MTEYAEHQYIESLENENVALAALNTTLEMQRDAYNLQRDWLAENATCAYNGEYEAEEGDNARKWIRAAEEATRE